MGSLKDKRIIITGASRGIGRAMALKFAADGACVALIAKSSEPHPTLPGTIHTVAEEVQQAGGKALAIPLDVRDEKRLPEMVEQVVSEFGGIDVLVNNAGAIWYATCLNTPAKRYDLMQDINVRAPFLLSQACHPHLKKSDNPHILNLSPPISLDKKWFNEHLGYTLSKYGLSMVTMGLAEEFKADHIAVNSLWPRTTIATSAIKVNFPDAVYQASRHPEIVADSAYVIINRDSRKVSGNCFIDETVLQESGVEDFDQYAINPGVTLWPDLFLESHDG